MKYFIIVANGIEQKVFDFRKAVKIAKKLAKKGMTVFVYDNHNEIVYS